MKRWRIIENEWNLKGAPWTGAVGIEEVDNDVAVPALVCWFMRGVDPIDIEGVVRLHNAAVDAEEERIRKSKEPFVPFVRADGEIAHW